MKVDLCDANHYPIFGYLGEKSGLCKLSNEFSITEIALAALTTLGIGSVLTKLGIQYTYRKLNVIASSCQILYHRLISSKFTNSHTLVSLESELKNSSTSYGRKCQIQIELKRLSLFKKFILPSLFLNIEEKFIVACHKGDISFLDNYYKNRGVRDKYFFNELIRFSTKETLHSLLQIHPGLISLRDNDGNLFIHYAAIYDRADLVSLFLNKKTSLIKLSGKKGMLPIHMAAEVGALKAAEALLKENATEQLLTMDKHHYYPICRAILANKPQMVRLLLQIAPNQRLFPKYSTHYLPIHFATREGHKEIVEILLEKYYTEQLQKYKDGPLPIHLPIHLAAKFNRPQIVRIFLKNVLMQRMEKDSLGNLPLHWAAAEGHKDVAKVLLEKNVKKQLSTVNGKGKLPIHMAADHPEMVLFLKEVAAKKTSD